MPFFTRLIPVEVIASREKEMITSTNSYSPRLQNSNNRQIQKFDTNRAKQSVAPTFKGGEGALVGFLTYTIADYLAILGGCSHVDFMFRKLGLRDARDFGVRSIKINHAEEFKSISNLSAHISQSLQENPATKKLGKRLQRVHETLFNLPLKATADATKPEGSTQDQLVELHHQVEKLFVKMNDTQRFTAIGKPLDTNIANISKDLAKIEGQPAPEVFDPFGKTKV